ncbi:hypothetical protein CBB_A0021 [Clostridium botulinum Bf]|nr:hypothetical protein CBB_A0021 [Clostridium botulinum Bf]
MLYIIYFITFFYIYYLYIIYLNKGTFALIFYNLHILYILIIM